MQAFTLLVFPLQFLNAFDAVLCAFLALALFLATLALKKERIS